MKKSSLTSLATILLGLLAGSNIQAANLASPSAILQVTVPVGKRVLLGTPFVRPEVSRGSIVSANAQTLTISGATYQVDQFKVGGANGNVTPYIIEILDGPNIGFVSYITGNGVSSITVEDSIPTGNPDNTRYLIREDYTVNSLLGSASAPKGNFASNTSPGNADQISFFNPNGKLETFFRWRSTSTIGTNTTYAWYLSAKSSNNWVSVADRRVPYGQGLIVERKANTAGTTTAGKINLDGEVRSTRLRRSIAGFPRWNIVSNPNPFNNPLSVFGLQMAPGDSTSADSVYVWNTNLGSKGGLKQYYRSDSSTWNDQTGAVVDPTSIIVPAGSAVVVQRGAGRTSALSGDSALKLNPIPILNSPIPIQH